MLGRPAFALSGRLPERRAEHTDVTDGNEVTSCRDQDSQKHRAFYSAGELGGIGDKIVVRVAYADSTIQDVEVLEQNETPEFGGAALEGLPENASPLEPAR